MPYTPDATVVTEPVEGTQKAVTAAAEFRTIKLYMRDVLLAGLNAKAPLASPALTGSVGINMPSPVSALQLGGINPVLTIGKQNDGVSYYPGLKIWSQYNLTVPAHYLSQDASGIFWQTAGSAQIRDGISGLTRLAVDNAGNVGINTVAHASALLDVQSTTKGFRLPNMTTAQKNAIASPAAGLMVFDTTLAKACLYTGAAWQTITSV